MSTTGRDPCRPSLRTPITPPWLQMLVRSHESASLSLAGIPRLMVLAGLRTQKLQTSTSLSRATPRSTLSGKPPSPLIRMIHPQLEPWLTRQKAPTPHSTQRISASPATSSTAGIQIRVALVFRTRMEIITTSQRTVPTPCTRNGRPMSTPSPTTRMMAPWAAAKTRATPMATPQSAPRPIRRAPATTLTAGSSMTAPGQRLPSHLRQPRTPRSMRNGPPPPTPSPTTRTRAPSPAAKTRATRPATQRSVSRPIRRAPATPSLTGTAMRA